MLKVFSMRSKAFPHNAPHAIAVNSFGGMTFVDNDTETRIRQFRGTIQHQQVFVGGFSGLVEDRLEIRFGRQSAFLLEFQWVTG